MGHFLLDTCYHFSYSKMLLSFVSGGHGRASEQKGIGTRVDKKYGTEGTLNTATC